MICQTEPKKNTNRKEMKHTYFIMVIDLIKLKIIAADRNEIATSFRRLKIFIEELYNMRISNETDKKNAND